ncbi:solute carrier family 22 member 23 isoform X3 [Mustela lutreola]|uniref:solute carrier family 22 member 23 isoform X3 n=1 Tax=Mustela lutreola TaxID=9666 RepID=UPI00279791F7|nr:solute carrier family 22 member 23 isoform X3 [Mustela lutreola]
MAIDRRREAAGGGPGRQPSPAEENGSLPPGDAAASAPLGGRAGPGGGGGEIQPLPAPHPAAGGPHPGCSSAAAAPSLLLLDYDGSVLPFLGGLGGGYQKTLVLLTWIPALFIGFSQFSDSFLLDQPNFWCRGAGKGAELAGVTATGRWDAGDLANWTSPPTTPFSTASWEAAGNLSNGSGGDGGDTPPLPSPPDKGDNASNCDCHAWDYGIRTGLVQNVVSKVTGHRAPRDLERKRLFWPTSRNGREGLCHGLHTPAGVLAQTLEFKPLDREPSTRVKKSGLAVLVTMDQRNRRILEELVVTLDLNGRGQRAHLRDRCEPNRRPGTLPQGCPTHPECCPC